MQPFHTSSDTTVELALQQSGVLTLNPGWGSVYHSLQINWLQFLKGQVSEIYGTSKFITMSTKFRRWFLYWHRRIQFNPSDFFFKICLNIILLFSPTYFKRYSYILVCRQNAYKFLTYSMPATWPAHLVLLELITSMCVLLVEEYNYEDPRYAVSSVLLLHSPSQVQTPSSAQYFKTGHGNRGVRHTSRSGP